MASQDNIDNRQTTGDGGFILNSLNRPLPWVALAFIITIAVSVFCVYRVAQAENEADRAKQTAFDAQTQCLLVADHVRDLREDMAAHGVVPLPTYPKRLK